MICKLCLEDRELKNSHVIPAFMFKSMFDLKNKIGQIDFNDGMKTTTSSGFGYEKLLCRDCEQKFSKLETYCADAIFGSRGINRNKKVTEVELAGDVHLRPILLKGLDYSKAKLFFLSLIWRASISNLPTFKFVELGKIEEELRKILITDTSCISGKYQIVLMKIEKDGTRPYMSILPVRKIKADNNTYYVFYINSFVIYINISSFNPIDLFKKGYLNELGEMTVCNLQGSFAQKMYDSLIGKGVIYDGPYQTK